MGFLAYDSVSSPSPESFKVNLRATGEKKTNYVTELLFLNRRQNSYSKSPARKGGKCIVLCTLWQLFHPQRGLKSHHGCG